MNETQSYNATSFNIQDRIDGNRVTIDQAKYAVKLWEEKYGTIEKLRVAAIEDRMPIYCDKKARTYLTTILDPNILFYSAKRDS